MVKTKSEVIKIIEKYSLVLKKVFEVDSIYLFESYAKGKPNKWSDIDLAVVSPDFSMINEYLAMVILSRLKREIDLSIEAIPITPDDLKNPLLGSIANTVLKEGQKII